MSEFVIGFALLFLGLSMMKEAMPDLRETPEVLLFITRWTEFGFGSVLICTVISVFLYELLIFGLGCFLSLTSADRLATHMMGAALSCCIIPLLYPVFKAIDKIGGTAWNE